MRKEHECDTEKFEIFPLYCMFFDGKVVSIWETLNTYLFECLLYDVSPVDQHVFEINEALVFYLQGFLVAHLFRIAQSYQVRSQIIYLLLHLLLFVHPLLLLSLQHGQLIFQVLLFVKEGHVQLREGQLVGSLQEEFCYLQRGKN